MESAKHHEDFQKVMHTAQNRILQFIEDITNLFGKILLCGLVISILVNIDKWGLLILILPISTTWIIGKKYNKETYEAEQSKLSGIVRKEYVKRCFYSRENSCEIRMTNVDNALKDVFDEGVAIINKCNKKHGVKKAKLSFVFELFKNRIPFSLILGYAVYQVMIAKTMSVVDISIMLIGLVNLSDQISDLVSSYTRMDESKRYIFDIDLYMKANNHVEVEGDIEVKELKNKIELKNVHFGYGHNDGFQLKNINLTIQKGEKIAIVGENGAGKTTLINLLLHLYQPNKGEIKLDGRNINQYIIEDYRKLFSVVLQDSKLFSLSVAENIICKETDVNSESIVNASLNFTGMEDKILKYTKGIESILFNEFDETGVNLSKGEMQKITIARAYVKAASIAIFDEPTSALDPLNEDEMLNKLLELSEDITAIFIMHRLSFAKKVDRIIVMDNGEIIEQGSHEELMRLNRKYAELFHLQASNYTMEGAE